MSIEKTGLHAVRKSVESGGRGCIAVRMVRSTRPMAMNNELLGIMHTLKASRLLQQGAHAGFDYTLDFPLSPGIGFPYVLDLGLSE